MKLFEKEFTIPAAPEHKDALSHIVKGLRFHLSDHEKLIRLAITESSEKIYKCEVGVLNTNESFDDTAIDSLFEFVPRQTENIDAFNTVLLVPTGIGSEIGGHAGDATPVAKLLGEVSDTVITHPNVVNASDINEMPDNALYVEGSVISRLLMGTIGLQKVRSNRVLFIIDAHHDPIFTNAAINAVSAARASCGFSCPHVIQLDPPVKMKSLYTNSGSAAGEIESLEYLCEVLSEYREEYDAIAISSVIGVPKHFHQEYFNREGNMVNPWGGVEAMLTHFLSSVFNVPSAHSPMFESQEIANANPGIVEPRMAAEAVSMTFLQCIFKGLQGSPRIVTDAEVMTNPTVITAKDISCIVIPDGCLGIPTLAAIEQGISVIAVRENKNLMKNDLESFSWKTGQLTIVDNYWEAAGVISSIRAGIEPQSVRRPLSFTHSVIKSQRETKDNEISKPALFKDY